MTSKEALKEMYYQAEQVAENDEELIKLNKEYCDVLKDLEVLDTLRFYCDDNTITNNTKTIYIGVNCMSKEEKQEVKEWLENERH